MEATIHTGIELTENVSLATDGARLWLNNISPPTVSHQLKPRNSTTGHHSKIVASITLAFLSTFRPSSSPEMTAKSEKNHKRYNVKSMPQSSPSPFVGRLQNLIQPMPHHKSTKMFGRTFAGGPNPVLEYADTIIKIVLTFCAFVIIIIPLIAWFRRRKGRYIRPAPRLPKTEWARNKVRNFFCHPASKTKLLYHRLEGQEYWYQSITDYNPDQDSEATFVGVSQPLMNSVSDV